MGGTRFMVQWEEHPSHLATRLGQLLEHQTLVDVTLMCNTHTLRVHRAVLAACSPYFETILQRQLGMHPLIVLKDMQFSVLKSLIEFMYCGETSVTEDNLGALLQAAKFFQVKGLSAMTKEALGLVPNAKSTINGDAARKAFVGRPKRVGMQQTFVTSGLKTVPASHSSSPHTSASSNELPTLSTKTTFQTISKPISARPDTQQQTDTAQLLLSLSGSEFPKQTFHTVSKNVRFQHNVSGSAVSESPRSSTEGNLKTKEVVGRIPVMTSSGGKTSAVVATTPSASTVSQNSQVAENPTTVGAVREDILISNPQSVYLAEGHRRRGRPVKRQMNMLFQEKMMTDADAALHKEAEASRKALEMLRQEMSSDGTEATVAAASNAPVPVNPPPVVSSPVSTTTTVSNLTQITNVPSENIQKGIIKNQVGSKLQVQSSSSTATTSRLGATQNVSSPVAPKRVNVNVNKTKPSSNSAVTNVAAKKNPLLVSCPTSVESTSNNVGAVTKVEEAEISQELYELSSDAQEPLKAAVEYQENSENVESESDANRNTNIVYQVTDSNSASAGSVMSQYMEVLKEAGLPTDVPILLDSGDGSYVTVNEEVLMNIVNGGVLQCHVTEGNFVAGDGVEFIVQEITEDEMEAVQAQVQEQSGVSTDLPKEMENNSEICNEENQISISDIKNPVERETIVAPMSADLQDGSHIEGIQEAPLSETQQMEVDNQILESSGTDSQKELESVQICGEDNDMKSIPLPESSILCSEQENTNVVVRTDCNSEILVEKSENENNANEQSNKENNVNITGEDNDEMSVEQALQAMMGDSSDTELESCAPKDDQGAVNEENVSGLEPVPQTFEDKKSEDLQLVLRSQERTEEEEEDLRLVLSNDDGDDHSDSYSLVGAQSGVHHVEEDDGQQNADVCETVEKSAELSSEITQEIGVEVIQENIGETHSTEHDEYERAAEERMEQVIDPLLVESISNEAPSSLGYSAAAEQYSEACQRVEEEDLEVGESTDCVESIPGNEVSGDSQEVTQLTSSIDDHPAEAASNSTNKYSKPKGAIISPSKDIPFAVGLLPLKTALEKLQAMPEYHPRKTRSSSTGKESAPDMPAARVKRKASSSDGVDKRMKLTAGEEGTVLEQPMGEMLFDGDTTMEVVASSLPEQRMEDSVLSMPELMTESTEG